MTVKCVHGKWADESCEKCGRELYGPISTEALLRDIRDQLEFVKSLIHDIHTMKARERKGLMG